MPNRLKRTAHGGVKVLTNELHFGADAHG
jgi:hypothetical protein